MLVTGHKTRAVFDGYADHALDSDPLKVAQANEETFKGIIPVGLAEFMTFASMEKDFEKYNCKLEGLSVDWLYGHIVWL